MPLAHIALWEVVLFFVVPCASACETEWQNGRSLARCDFQCSNIESTPNALNQITYRYILRIWRRFRGIWFIRSLWIKRRFPCMLDSQHVVQSYSTRNCLWPHNKGIVPYFLTPRVNDSLTSHLLIHSICPTSPHTHTFERATQSSMLPNWVVTNADPCLCCHLSRHAGNSHVGYKPRAQVLLLHASVKQKKKKLKHSNLVRMSIKTFEKHSNPVGEVFLQP